MSAEKDPTYTAPGLVFGVFQISHTGKQLVDMTVYESLTKAQQVRDDLRLRARYSGVIYEAETLRVRV